MAHLWVTMNPAGIVILSEKALAMDDIGLRAIVLHEVGHVLGVDNHNPKWRDFSRVLSTTRKERYYYGPRAVIEFDRLGGDAFPQTTRKIPIHDDRTGSHWDPCSGLNDIMQPVFSRTPVITWVTLASLEEGYVYRGGESPRLDQNRWNLRYYNGRFFNCVDGRNTESNRPATVPPLDDDNVIWFGDDVLREER